jgi:hypothetical protein
VERHAQPKLGISHAPNHQSELKIHKQNHVMLQWLYTAITRATEKLYFINFDERFFDEK